MNGGGGAFAGFLILVLMAAFYFLPTILGAVRHKRNTLAIFALNLLLGWTVIGWIVALVWGLTSDQTVAPQQVTVINAPAVSPSQAVTPSDPTQPGQPTY